MKTKGISIKFFVSLLVLILLVFSFSMVKGEYASSWRVKILYSTSDVYNFLNRLGGYKTSIQDARISYTRIGSLKKFTIFYKVGPSSGSWGWKLSTTPTDVVNFLNAVPPYSRSIKRAEIAGAWAGYYREFYVFYQTGYAPGKQWQWKASGDYNNILNCLNGNNRYATIASNTRIVAMDIYGSTYFYAFYQPSSSVVKMDNWGMYETTDRTDAIIQFDNAEGGDICSVYKSGIETFYVLMDKAEIEIRFNNETYQVQKFVTKITTNNYTTGYKDITETYDTYTVITPQYESAELQPTLRILCPQPCQIPEDILAAKAVGGFNAIVRLLAFTQIDVVEELKPVDVHLTSCLECGDYQKIFQAEGYVPRYVSTRNSGGSYMCLWEWDDNNLILSLNPKFAEAKGQDAIENALRLEAQGVLVHEYGHILFFKRSEYSPEDWVKFMDKWITGIWTGNGFGPESFLPLEGPCDPVLNSKYQGKSIYNLCKNCGFKETDIAKTLAEINMLYLAGEGEKDVEQGLGMLSKAQFKAIVDNIVGADSAINCGVVW